MNEQFKTAPHRRYNPLTNEWVLVSPHRTQRPWQGQQENSVNEDRPQYDSKCYLCPDNERAGGHKNPKYENTFVFENDFAALLPDSPNVIEDSELFKSHTVKGTSHVICFSPRHDLTLPEMEAESIQAIINLWISQTEELSKKYKWVQVFENKGSIMGSSNPHPHGQIWASDSIPNEPLKENKAQQEYFGKNKSILLLDYLVEEKKNNERIIIENKHWVSLVPYWAVWPFETMLLPRRHVLQLTDLSDNEKKSLAEILKLHLIKYDNIFNTSFPYTMGWHGAPFDGKDNSHWQLHAHFYPPLLRSSTIKKFMVGYEMLAEAQRDITAEQAADKLKSLSLIHYKNNNENN
jgi:UDPglucose--hexose-1-phosphate uridylyltransferase